MNIEFLQEMLGALGSSLEKVEANQAALLQFIKDKGLLSEEEFAPYLAQAETTSGVRWRAVRVRLDSLIAKEQEREERAREEKAAPKKPGSEQADKASADQSSNAKGDVAANEAQGGAGKPRPSGPDPFRDVDKQVAEKDEGRGPDGSKTGTPDASPQANQPEKKAEARNAGT